MSCPRSDPGVVSDANAAILRRMTITERLECAFRLRDRVLNALANGVRGRHPEWTERQVRLEASRKLTEEEFDDIPQSLMCFDGKRDLQPD